MVRTFFAIPLAAALSLALFYALAYITGLGKFEPIKETFTPSFDLFMVREDQELTVLSRERPPIPEEIQPQQQPDMPKVKPDLNVQVSAPMPEIQVPNIEVGISMNLSPSLNDLAQPTVEITFDANPIAVSRTNPRYPSRAQRRGVEGQVTVEFMVSEIGTVMPESVKVISSTPKGVFDKAVMKAIKRWRFKPKLSYGTAQPFRARQTLEFKMEK